MCSLQRPQETRWSQRRNSGPAGSSLALVSLCIIDGLDIGPSDPRLSRRSEGRNFPTRTGTEIGPASAFILFTSAPALKTGDYHRIKAARDKRGVKAGVTAGQPASSGAAHQPVAGHRFEEERHAFPDRDDGRAADGSLHA